MQRAVIKDIPRLVKILTPAFIDNLSVNRCVKQDDKRVERIKKQIEYISKISIRNNLAYINNDRTGALLCNMSTGKGATIFEDIYYIFNVSGLILSLQLLKREKELSKILPKEEYCHLWFIAVEPEYQAKGYGAEMLSFIKQECKQKQYPIFLETSNPNNIMFYEKNGFKMYKKIRLSTDDFEVFFFSWYPNWFKLGVVASLFIFQIVS